MTIAIDANSRERSVSVEQQGEKVFISIYSPDEFTLVTLNRVEWDVLVAGVQ
jgi:hypothetical protein